MDNDELSLEVYAHTVVVFRELNPNTHRRPFFGETLLSGNWIGTSASSLSLIA